MIVIINYGMGNLHSVYTQCKRVGFEPIISSNPDEINNADKLILPGVGHFKKGMENLNQLDLIDVLSEKVIQQETPIFGICLGMQLFSKKSKEGDAIGLGWIDAETNRFQINDNKKYKIPHMGWNNVFTNNKSLIMKGISKSDEFYFVHSYHLECEDEDIIIGETDYCYRFVSAIQKDNIYGTQFHPEKSHDSGLKILKNFLETV